MTDFRLLPTALAFGVLLASCAQKLPDVKDIDLCYKRAEAMAQTELQDLERRRAAGQIDEYRYQQQKAEIESSISRKAMDIAWTTQALETSRRASQGIPTADNPQEIAVPQAGTLATGGDYRRFNDQSGGVGTTADTMNGMKQMMSSGYMPGAGGYGKSRGQ